MDERRFNFRKNPGMKHKIRVIAGNKMNPVMFGITVPEFIAQKFSGCSLRMFTSGTMIIMESGCKITPQDVNPAKKYCYEGLREGLEIGGQMQWLK